MLLFIVLILSLTSQINTFTDRELYPDLFGKNGQRRNEIDSRNVYNYNRPTIGGFTTRWSDEFVTMIFVGTPSELVVK
jgi:hypothetical protein